MMNDMTSSPKPPLAKLPSRLHHTAWVVEDQERTRAFYEDVLGFPLVAFWVEVEPFGDDTLVLSHSFFGLEDGSALAFFNMADERFHERFKSPKTEMFNHVALNVDKDTQEAIKTRVDEAGIPSYIIDHGYCHSLYVVDPDGLRLEFAVDAPNVEAIDKNQRSTAHESLRKWMEGRRDSNNTYR